LVSSPRLSTTGNRSTLRTRSNSESSSSMSFSDTSSVAGHKRSFPEVGTLDLQKTVKPMEKTRAKKSTKSGKVSSRYIASQSVQFPRARRINTSASETLDEEESESVDGLGTKRRRVVKDSREDAGSSASNLLPVPLKADAAQGQATTDGPTAITRGRGRGRGLAPSRLSSRIANSRNAARNSRPVPTPSSSSQNALKSGQTNKGVPPLRDRNMRN